MVSRRTRSYKDKGPAGIFGQFMLPIAVIMAIALLYFSIKLFFVNSSVSRRQETAGSRPAVSAEVPGNTPVVAAEQPAPQAPSAPPAQVVAGPVDGQSAQAGPKPQQPSARPSGTKPDSTQQATPPAKPQPTAPKPAQTPAVKRYDVQIGAFSARDNAVQLVQKARAQGYEVYVNESEREGPPYRVRVKGTADRQKTEVLSTKLKEQGYPIYVVTIN